MRTLVWFRGKDLRVSDHPPLVAAARGGDVIPVFVLDPYFFAPSRAQKLPHRMQFLLESIQSLAKNLERLGTRLLVVSGKSTDVIPKLAERWKVDRVAAHAWSEPFGRARDRRIEQALRVPFDLAMGETLAPGGSIRTKGGEPFSVFTPFARTFDALAIDTPIRAPRSLPPLPSDVSVKEVPIPSLQDLGITPNPRILAGGERAARDRLDAFVRGPGARYKEDRDRMDKAGTSRLSVDLKFGTLSVRAVWHAVESIDDEARSVFRNELLWREFAYHTMFDRPEVLERPFRPAFESFSWHEDERSWRAWVDGTTGYPIVDAAARQLKAEGFVHNRARMIAASFLCKHLLIDYRKGEAHYMKLLTDGDWASNNMGWQWSAGCGCDAQPYFRVFNPTLQAERFDPDGAYVRRWVEEIDRPSYPKPIVDHAFARDRFLKLANSRIKSR